MTSLPNRIPWSDVKANMNKPKRGLHYNPKIVTAFFASEGLPTPTFEHVHIPGRKFRLDVAWPECRVGIEVQGGIWLKAAHSTGTGIKRDMEKRNLSLLNGWRVLEVEPQQLCLVETASAVKRLMDDR